MTMGWKDEHAAASAKATLLGELGDKTGDTADSMWAEGCDELTTYVLAKVDGRTIACEFHTVKRGQPGVVSGECGSDNPEALDEIDEEPRPGYLASTADLLRTATAK